MAYVTWGQIREEFTDAYRDTTTRFFDNSSGGTSEIARTLRRVLRLVNAPEAYSFQQQEYTLTLTGATRYDLNSLIPGWKRIYAILAPGTNVSEEMTAADLRAFQLTYDTYAFSIFGHRYLELKSSPATPSTGSLKIIYFTGYLVKDGSTNALKEIPTSDDDYFIIPPEFMDVVTEGLEMFAFRKDKTNRSDYTDARQHFDARLEELRENHLIEVDTLPTVMRGGMY